ncbi:MAG: cell division protein FtsZ [Candidatus Thermoplasmatota archaeon]|nr:cell division protein FtsZ [Candidatus Thermoplasmatota archaeon]
MKSLVEDAISKAAKEEGAAIPGASTGSGADPDLSTSNEELEELLSGLNTKVKVIGCGGAGTNTVDRLFEANVEGAEFYALNTDAQHLLNTPLDNKLLIGRHLTKGLGAGSLPQVGEQAAKESEAQIKKIVEGADLVFVTCGLGGGTGTGSAPVVAKAARDADALTIGVCTLPFKVEGQVRMKNAEAGLARLRDAADTTLVVPNDKLLEIAPQLPLNAAFRVADEVLLRSIKGITEMITKPGLVNLDFADLKTIMKKGGVAMIGLGEGEGERRMEKAMKEALHSPLIDVDLTQATGALINVVGGPEMTISEAEGVAHEIFDKVRPDSRIIWGCGVDKSLRGKARVMLVVTGVKSSQILGPGKNAPKAKGTQEVDFVI